MIFMGRKKLIKTDQGSYHIWARANNKDSFPLSSSRCWGIFNYYLNELVLRYGVKIHAFVLMSNHFHMVISTPNANLDQCMRYFMTQTSKGMSMASDRINHVYGGPYGWTLIESPITYAVMIKYVYRNPVKANICNKVELYPWSTLTNKNIKYILEPKPEFDEMVPKEEGEQLSWLNQNTKSELESEIWSCVKSNGHFKNLKNKNRYAIDIKEYITRI